MGKFNLEHFDYRLIPSLSFNDEEELSNELRKAIIKDVSLNGGHLSSNLGIVDLVVALLKQIDPQKGDILFDVGHQCYAYKILTGRSLSKLRTKDGPSGFPDIEESPFDKYESGHSGAAISAAIGMAAAKKAKGDTSPTVVVIGDASIASGIAFEGINNLDYQTYGKVIIILNDNNMSISKPQGAVSAFFNRVRTSIFYQSGARRFKKIFNHKGISWIYKAGVKCKNVFKRTVTRPNLFDNFNCTYLGPIDGHNLKKMDVFIKRALQVEDNVILHVKTLKGKGYKLAEEDEEGYWHSTSPFDTYLGLPLIKHDLTVSLSNLSGKYIIELLNKDPKTVVITPAMKKGSHLEEAFNLFPNRCFDAGIAEEHALEMAAGLALKGSHPIVCIYSTFMQRGYDQILNEICRMKLPILIVVDRAGLTGSDGPSHQGIFDLAMVLPIPNNSIYMPYSPELLRRDIIDYGFESSGPRFIRLERDYCLKSNQNKNCKMEDYSLAAKSDSSTCLVCLGIEGELAKKELSNQVNVVSLNKLKPVNKDLLLYLKTQDEVIVYDPTSVKMGYSSYLLSELVALGYKGEFTSCAVENEYVPHMTKKEQIEYEKVSLDDLKKLVKAHTEKKGGL